MTEQETLESEGTREGWGWQVGGLWAWGPSASAWLLWAQPFTSPGFGISQSSFVCVFSWEILSKTEWLCFNFVKNTLEDTYYLLLALFCFFKDLYICRKGEFQNKNQSFEHFQLYKNTTQSKTKLPAFLIILNCFICLWGMSCHRLVPVPSLVFGKLEWEDGQSYLPGLLV